MSQQYKMMLWKWEKNNLKIKKVRKINIYFLTYQGQKLTIVVVHYY